MFRIICYTPQIDPTVTLQSKLLRVKIKYEIEDLSV